jgi:hypothetical protein
MTTTLKDSHQFNWSSERPIDPGFYWVCEPHDGLIGSWTKPRIVGVSHLSEFTGDDEDDELHVSVSDYCVPLEDQCFEGWLWMGPIASPDLPTHQSAPKKPPRVLAPDSKPAILWPLPMPPRSRE